MKDVIAFIIAVPLTVELFGALYAVFDAWRDRDSRSAALERLAIPLAAWGVLWWWVGADGWQILAAAFAAILVCHIAVFYAGRWLIQRSGVQTLSVDTDRTDDPA
jgi:hypothetical protein